MAQRGGSRTTMTTPHVAQTKPMKAKHGDNQGALDRLFKMLERAGQSNFVLTLNRAMKSVRDCKHPITTIEQARELKYVGDRLSRVIVPDASRAAPRPAAKRPPSTATSTSVAEPPKKRKTTKQTTLTGELRDEPSTSMGETTNLSTKEKAYESAKKEAEQMELPSGPWKVILLVDCREHKSRNVVSKCQQSGIPCEERALPIGDMAWIARCHTSTGTLIEVLAGTILERKEVNDLAGSIFGTRFLEQRLRLYQCGQPQVLYLVEGDLNSVVNCPAETLRMAMMETRVQLGFSVVQTKHLDNTVQTLKGLHRRIVQRTFPDGFNDLPTFTGRNSGPRDERRRRRQRRPSSLLEQVFGTPPVPPFGTARFNTYTELKAKVERDRQAGTKTVGAIYMAMLKQVTSLSQKKCQAIATEYPTWNHLLSAYDEVCESSSSSSPQNNGGTETNTERPKTALLVKDVLNGRQKVGPKSAEELDITCCMEGDGTLMKVREGRSALPKLQKAGSTTARTKMPAAAVVSSSSDSTTASRTTSTSSDATSASSSGRSGVPASPFVDSTNHAASSSCFDLTADSPAPKKKSSPAHRPNAFPTSYESTWCNGSISNYEESNRVAPIRGTVTTHSPSSPGSAYDGKNVTKSPNQELHGEGGIKSLGQTILALDTDDDESEHNGTKAFAAHTLAPTERAPKVDTRNLSKVSSSVESFASKTVAVQPRRESQSDATVYFSSPSSTASGQPLSQDSNHSSNSNAKKRATDTNATFVSFPRNNSGNQHDASIVVIDSSDEEDDAAVDSKAVSSATTPLLRSSQESSKSAEPEGLRARLAKRLGTEMIEID